MQISSRSKEFIAWWRSSGRGKTLPSCADINLEEASRLLEMIQYLKWSETGNLVTSMLGTQLDKIGGGNRTGRCALELTHPGAKEESREFFTRLEEQPCGAVVNMLFKESGGLARHYEMVILPVSAPGHRNRFLAFVEPGATEIVHGDEYADNTPRILRHLASAFLDIGHGVPDQMGLYKGLKVLDLNQLPGDLPVWQESETIRSGIGYGLLRRPKRRLQFAQ